MNTLAHAGAFRIFIIIARENMSEVHRKERRRRGIYHRTPLLSANNLSASMLLLLAVPCSHAFVAHLPLLAEYATTTPLPRSGVSAVPPTYHDRSTVRFNDVVMMATTTGAEVVVVGSCNTDLVTYTSRLPSRGEW